MDSAAKHLLFAHHARRDDDQIDLAVSSLLIAEEAYPGLDVSHYVKRLDEIGAAVRRNLEGKAASEDPAAAILAINHVLFEREGFHGNIDDYYDPKNSFMNEVIDRKLGIPITLSVLYLEVGARIDLPLCGVGFPGHFLVKHVAGERQIVIDPFFSGRTLDLDDLAELLQRAVGAEAQVGPQHLEPVGKGAILARMLRNLRGVYLEANDVGNALSAVERLLILDPRDEELDKERDELRAKLAQA